MSKNTSQMVVLYHRNCRDGFGAALAANLYCQNEKNDPPIEPFFWGLDPDPVKLMDGLEKLVENYQEIPIKERPIVRSFDVAFNPDGYDYLMNNFEHVIIVDHHKSVTDSFNAKERQLPANIKFNNEKSGCVLAWEFFFPETDKYPVPELFLYLQDRDLWKTTMPDSEIMNEGLFTLMPVEYGGAYNSDSSKPDFTKWMTYLNPISEWKPQIYKIGKMLIDKKKHELNMMSKNARLATLISMETSDGVNYEKYRIVWVNATNYISDIGNVIAGDYQEKADFALILRVVGDDTFMSLRSVGNYDVSQVARRHNGGGHRNAAGMQCKNSEIEICRSRADEIIVNLYDMRERLSI